MALELKIPGGDKQLNGNIVHAEIETTETQGDAYRLLCKTTSLDDSFPEGVDSIEPTGLKSVFDLRSRVSMPVDYDFAWPLTGDVFIKRPQLARQVAIDIGESFIDESGEKIVNWAELSENNTVLILKGAISIHEQSIYNEQGKTFYQEFIEAGRFLTNLPNTQRIAPGQPVKLWFITKEAVAQEVTLKVNYTRLNGTNDMLSIAGTIDPDSMYEICVDTGSLGLTAAEIDTYTVSLEKEGVSIGQSVTFAIDHTIYENNTFMFAANRVGAVDSIWFHGHVKAYFPTESETSQRNAQITDTQKKSTLEVDWKSGIRKWEINSGYRTVEEQLSLKTLLESSNIWITDGNNIIPVNLEDGDNLLYDTFDMLTNIPSIELTFREAH